MFFIKKMNLEKINLNLLVALDALLSERHVTRAALKVHITQSAMSIALAQLRALLQDKILVRDRGAMQPTPRALELQPQVRHILEQIKKIIHEAPLFDPATTTKIFRIGMTDYTEFLVLPRLLATLAKNAPGITLKVINLNLLDHHEVFEKEQLDLAVGVLFEEHTPLQTQILLTETAVCVADKNHSLMKKQLTLKEFLQAKHIAINLHSMKVLGRIDKALHDLGVKRDIVLATPHLVAAFHLVRNTDYLMASMRHLSEKLTKPFGLVMQELPFAVESLDLMMAWPKSFTSDPAHCWLRQQIRI
ncbi:MAG: LysR family transcriptional regulator [Proteobacteria bacterium]|nr:LysR family transcriptional regulator [Pseudomonadota bacterium]